MPLVTVRDKVKNKLGYSGLRIGWEKDKARVRELYPDINLRLLNQNLGPSIDDLSWLIWHAQMRTKLQARTSVANGLPEILAHKQAILNIAASYRAICNAQINDANTSEALREGWRQVLEGIARVVGRIETINGPY